MTKRSCSGKGANCIVLLIIIINGVIFKYWIMWELSATDSGHLIKKTFPFLWMCYLKQSWQSNVFITRGPRVTPNLCNRIMGKNSLIKPLIIVLANKTKSFIPSHIHTSQRLWNLRDTFTLQILVTVGNGCALHEYDHLSSTKVKT